MKNLRRLYRQYRFCVMAWATCLIVAPTVGIFRTQIISFLGKQVWDTLIWGSSLGIFVGLFLIYMQSHQWHSAIHTREWQQEDCAFLIKIFSAKMSPGYSPSSSADDPFRVDECQEKIAVVLWQLLHKMDADALVAMPTEQRRVVISLLKVSDTRIVKRVLELIEEASLVEALPMVQRLAAGKFRTSVHVYIAPIAERVLDCLKTYQASELQQYLRASTAPNDELLHPATHTAQEDNLLRPNDPMP